MCVLQEIKLKRESRKQHGMVLVTSLLLLLVLSMVAAMALESSHFAYKMSSNRLAYEEVFHYSESARKVGINTLQSYLDEGGAISASTATITSKINIQPNILQLYYHYQRSDAAGDVYVSTGATIPNSAGAGSAQYQGYRGAGIGMGAKGSLVKLYEVRSSGYRAISKQDAPKAGRERLKVWTASDFRYVF